MKKYLKLFKNHNDYLTFKQNITKENFPNVSHCIDTDDVHYNPKTWADEYFTTVARGNGKISFNILKSMGTDKITSISYSTDNGATWTTTANQNNKEKNLSITVIVNEGDKILWKGIAETLGFFDGKTYDSVGSFFSSTAKFDAAGNVMSLIYGDNFKGQTDLTGKDYAFYGLFNSNSNLVNAQNLSLPATTLAEYCYAYMFDSCTSLVTAPELPDTTLATGCYADMFYGCTSLVTAPELPATTLATGCYADMFYGCTSLVTAPELPATTLTSNCYAYMFYGCSSLNYIKAMFTTTPGTDYTSSWVSGVASSGTFVKNAAATWNVTGTSGIPSGWTVVTE